MPSKLRKQRDRERKQKTRNKLLDAASQAFAENGYHPTLISDIVARAQVGQGTFYRHFASKREALSALFERLFQRLWREFDSMSAALPANADQYYDSSLKAVSQMALAAQQESTLVLFFLREGSAIDSDFEDQLQSMYDSFARLAQSYLEHAIGGGFARECDIAIVSQSIVGMALRMAQLWLNGRLGSQSLMQLVRQVVDFAFFGLSKGAEKGSSHER